MPDPIKPSTRKKFVFKVKAGRHVGNKHEGNGGRVYLTGDRVETDVDLIAVHGPEKFELISGPKNAAKTRSVVDPRSNAFPGGQVHDGRQKTGATDDDGNPVSGPITPEDDTEDETEAEPSGETEEAETEEEQEAPDFDTMSVGQLREYAAENEIDLTGANTKSAIVKKLKAGG